MENRKIVIAGQALFTKIFLEELKTKPDLVVSGDDNPVADFCLQNNIPRQDKLVTGQPLVMAAYGKIVGKDFLPCLNVHPSLLPLYRGASPLQTALLNGEKETGVTIIIADEQMDHGEIVCQEKVAIAEDETLISLTEKTAKIAARMIDKIIPVWPNVPTVPQDHAKATLTKVLTREDGRIDWNKEVEYIERQVRAFNPWPGAFCESNCGRLKIIESSILPLTGNGPFGPPGKTYMAPDNKIAVQTINGFLIINKLQLAGRRLVSVEDFLLGNIDFIGQTLK
jgi:methionyl-tRNA formyltransferase